MKVITDLPRTFKPTKEKFLNEFVIPKRPVIISGAFEHWGATNWNLKYLKEKIGNKEFSYRSEAGRVPGKFSDMISDIEISTRDNPAPYLRNVNLLKAFPELRKDIFPNIAYMENNWRNHWTWPKNWPSGVSRDLFELFISGAGVSFPRLHIDYWGMDGFVAQIFGMKEFILYSTEDTPHLYVNHKKPLESNIDDFDNPNFEKYPELKKATQYRIQLRPGELLYNPGWWHTTKTLETSITIIMAYWNQANYPLFLSEIERVYKDCNKLKTYFLVQYFKTLGYVFSKRSAYPLAD